MYSASDHLNERNYSAMEQSIGHFEHELDTLEPLAQNIDKPQDFTELREILFDLGPSKIKQSLERLDEEPPLPNLDS